MNIRLSKVTLLVLSVYLLAGCAEKYELDLQLEELCKKDGGVKIYETVKLPPEMFDEFGYPFPGWQKRARVDRLGSEFLFEEEKYVLKEGNPWLGKGLLIKFTEKIYRRSNHSLIGESVSYGRSGGDFIVLGHISSAHCPIFQNASETLIQSVFIKEEK
jgi:hypothetical protein